MSNHLDRFHAAVSSLAGHGNIKQRLIVAFEDHLANVESDEVPGVEPLNGEGRIRATVRKMSVLEADECAQKMIDLYTDIIRYEDQAQDSVPLRIADQPLLPPFLVKSG